MLRQQWQTNQSLVCVGLDPEPERFPVELAADPYPIFSFNKLIIDATATLVCAYKPQMAHYSAKSAELELEMTIDYIHQSYPQIPVILDAKRGDVGSTAQYYAQEAFERYKADAVTVNPYLGFDSLEPFFAYSDKGIIVLCRTSNPGSMDIQTLMLENTTPLYLHIAQLAATQWNKNNNVLLVVGATHPDALQKVRSVVGNMPLLVPGIGAQGGDVMATVSAAQTQEGNGLIISASRSILYHDPKLSLMDYSKEVSKAAAELREQVNQTRFNFPHSLHQP